MNANRFLSWTLMLFVLLLNCQYVNGQQRPEKKKPIFSKDKPIQKSAQQDRGEISEIPLTEQDTSNRVQIKSADEVEGIYSDNETIQFLKGNVVLYQDSAYFFCDSAYMYENQNAVHAWGNVTIIQSDTIEVFCDTLKYFGDTEDAFMVGDVVLKDTTQEIYTQRLDYNMKTKLAVYETGGLLKQDDAQLTSTYGRYNADTDQAYFRDSVIVINDKFTMKADSLLYDTETKKSTFIGKTLIIQDSAKIYCESGFYDYQNEKAVFDKNPQYQKGEKIATADLMNYDGANEEIILTGNAKFKDGNKRARADKMYYYEEEDKTRLEGNAYFKDEEQEVEADVIIYNGKDGSYNTEGKTIARTDDSTIMADNSSYDKTKDETTLTGNVIVADSSQILSADEVVFNNTTEDAIATGNVFWQDTVNDVSIKSEVLEYNKDTDYVKATGRPLMTTIMDGDSLYLSADTLISETLIVEDSLGIDSTEQLLAINNVRMFKSDFQAVCDSLHYNSTDSIFQFYEKPVIWSDSSQFSGDTVIVNMRNESIDSVYLLNRAFIVDTPDERFFNQIKGNRILIDFQEEKPHKMDVLQNSESVYYVQEEDGAYVGPNKSSCTDMELSFEDGELQTILFKGEAIGNLYPMKTANHQEMTLSGFKWESKRRPSGPDDVLVLSDNNNTSVTENTSQEATEQKSNSTKVAAPKGKANKSTGASGASKKGKGFNPKKEKKTPK